MRHLPAKQPRRPVRSELLDRRPLEERLGDLRLQLETLRSLGA